MSDERFFWPMLDRDRRLVPSAIAELAGLCPTEEDRRVYVEAAHDLMWEARGVGIDPTVGAAERFLMALPEGQLRARVNRWRVAVGLDPVREPR